MRITHHTYIHCLNALDSPIRKAGIEEIIEEVVYIHDK